MAEELQIPAEVEARIGQIVDRFVPARARLASVLETLQVAIASSEGLSALIHSSKARVKDPDHLRDSLRRKWRRSQRKGGKEFDVTPDNLFRAVNDLAGFRILHLYTQQVANIDRSLKEVFEEHRYPIVEGPIAKTWDDESRRFFEGIGIATEDSETMYTSVHYVIQNNTRTDYTIEIQVRTLMEEVWGEVDHTINYPRPCSSLACREQISALARVTSGCTRLVDSIFRSYADWKAGK
jgi:putative GTP pyrophosphokinase